MSTPTTATATLAHYNPQHYAPYSHHSSAYQAGSSSSFRSAAGGNGLSSSSRLVHSYAQSHIPPPPIAAAYSHGAAAASPPSISSLASSVSGSDPNNPKGAYSPAALPARQAQPDAMNSIGRKRRRGTPDWTEFYRNGLPKEIIVIDDTPQPEQPQKPPPDTAVVAKSACATNGAVPGTSDGPSASKRRKREGDDGASSTVKGSTTARHDAAYVAAHQDAIYFAYGSTVHHSPNATNSSSSGRTASAATHLMSTASTSIGSSSSNVQYGYAIQPGQKRKRTTRQQANDAKRQQAEALLGVVRYKTPAQPIKKSGEIKVRVVPDLSSNKHVKYDDEDGHFIVVPEAELTPDYQILHLLGQGTFGKVVKARDRRRDKPVAIKIIRSVQKYRDASRIELRVLATLKANDTDNRNRCIHLRDCFDYKNHICIVMDLLDQSVFDFLKGNSYVPFPNSQIQSFARQLFTSVAFLHDLNLIHTDLKPENILLCHSAYQTFTYNRKIPSSSTTVSRQATKRKVLLDTEIRLIDFGSATFNDEYHSSVVSTRHYRAPEIILGLGWSFECDIWSIGCILVEFFTGDALFQTHDNLEHLAMMEAVVGHRIDQHLVQQVNRMTRNGGNPASQFFKRYKLDYPTPETGRASRRFVRGMKQLKQIIPNNNTFLRNFLDLLEKIFVYDPKRRITAKEALKHPWFQEAPYPDDGTEAAKIRRERMGQDIPGSRSAPLHV